MQTAVAPMGISARTFAARLLVWPACVAAIAVHMLYAHDDYSETTRLQAGLLCCIALLSTAYSPRRAFPSIAIALGYFYAALGQPIFDRTLVETVDGPVRLSSRSFDQATLGALILASAAFITAFLVDRAAIPWSDRYAERARKDRSYGERDTTVARVVAGTSLLLRTLLLGGVSLGALNQPAGLFASPIIPLTLLFWDADRTGRAGARYVFWGAFAWLFVIGMFTGMLSEALTPGVIAAGLLWAKRGKLPGRMFLAGLALLLILSPAKAGYRNRTWYGVETSTWDKVTAWVEALEETYAGKDSASSFEASVSTTNSRVSTLGQVAQVFDWVPEHVPFAGAERWLYIPVMLMPRVLWPDKPAHHSYLNRDYTYTFRLQSKREFSVTSITLPAVGDGYWRLGWTGIAIEGALLGLLLGIGQGVSRAGSRGALLLAGSLMVIRTDYHPFGQLNGLLQASLVALAVLFVAKHLGSRGARTRASALPQVR